MTTSSVQSSAPDDLRGAAAGVSSGGAPFRSGGEFTVGAEEELLLVGADDQLLPDAGESLVQALGRRPEGTTSRELYGAEIEFATAVGRSGEEVCEWLATFREELRRAGGRPMAVGLHPSGGFGDIALTVAPRYDLIGSTLAGLLRTPTAALQVHVGMPDAASAIAAFRGLRHDHTVLRALACGSPYWHGRDSGLASARWAVVQSYPRGGVPPLVRSWDEYAALAEALLAAAEVPDFTHLWWDVRLQPRFGTVELRAMDAQPSLATAAGLIALTQGLARHAVERPSPTDLPTQVLTENNFRVARYGLEARIVDRDGTMRPVRQLAARAVAEARAVLGAEGLDAPLEVVERLLGSEPEYERQRRIHAEHGMGGLLRDLVRRTGTTD